MKKIEKQPVEMKPEYDFTGCKAVRGKNHKPLHKGYSVNVVLRSVIELAKHLPGGERYRQEDKSARQAAEN